MSSSTTELVAIVEALPDDKAREVVDLARFLQLQAGDAEWERIIGTRRAYPKPEQFAAVASREGVVESLDPDKL
jgi:hypothetical protein